MLLKFKAKTMPVYQGPKNKNGELMHLKSGDIIEVQDDIAKLLLASYGRDFEVSLEEKPIHAPKLDKQLKKTASFKSK